MDGYGTEGALVAIIMILAKIIWDQVKQRKAPGNPHNPLCEERGRDIRMMRQELTELGKKVAALEALIKKRNGG